MWLISPRIALVIASLVSAGLLLGAHLFERVGGFPPCALCLDQREVHWAVLLLAGAGAVASRLFAEERLITACLGALILLYVFSAGLATYHAGAEWGFWQGPSGCSGASGDIPTSVDLGSLLDDAPEEVGPLPACDEAPWRLAGISMAGYNALISLCMAVVAALGCGWTMRRWARERAQSGVRIA